MALTLSSHNINVHFIFMINFSPHPIGQMKHLESKRRACAFFILIIMIVLSAYIAVLNAGVLIIMMSDYQNQVSKICNTE